MRNRFVFMCLLAILGLGNALANAAAPVRPAAALVPAQAILVVQIRHPETIARQLLSDRVVKTVKNLPFYDQVMNHKDTKQALKLIEYFETKHSADVPKLIEALTGGGITFAVGPKGEILLIVDAKDKAFLNEVHDFFKMVISEKAAAQGDAGRVASADYRGVTGWKFGPNEVHAIIGSRLLMSNKPEVLKAVLDLRAAGSGGIADNKAYQHAVQAAGKDALVVAYANMEVLKQVPGIQSALNSKGNPLGTLLFAPLQTALGTATWASASVCLPKDAIQIKLATDGVPDAVDSPRGFASFEKPDAGALPNLVVPHRIAAFSFYRDLHKFYAAKDELFPERTSGLIFFENMMGIFFTGRDLTEEVLAETLPYVRVVVAQQHFSDKTGIPAVQFPGFALVMRLRDRKKFAPVVEEAWQKAIGLVNFTRGQKALPGLIIDRPEYHGNKYTMAYFSAADEPDATHADARFNFQPSLAFEGDYLILSSTRQLTEDLIDALRKEAQQQVKPVAEKHTIGVVDGVNLASILAANRAALVRQNMVEDGNSRAQAEKQIDILLELVRHLRDFTIEAGFAHGRSQSTLKLSYILGNK